MRRPPGPRPRPFEYRPRPHRPGPAPRRRVRTSGDLVFGVALAGVALLFLFAFNGWLLTKRDVSVDYLGHALARFTEIDRLMAQNLDGMRETARTDTEGTVRL